MSDRRSKLDIQDTKFGLSFLNQLRVVDYRYNHRDKYRTFNETTKEFDYEVDNGQHVCKRTHTGFISQEVQQTLTDNQTDHALFQINNFSDSDVNSDDSQYLVYQEVIGMAVRAIQELSAKVDILEAKIASLLPHSQ